jgi:hypothetical protein
MSLLLLVPLPLLLTTLTSSSIDAVDEVNHLVYFSGNTPTALTERHAYVASYLPDKTARYVYIVC